METAPLTTVSTQGNMDFAKFRPLDMKLIERVDKMLSDDIARLMAMVPLEERMGREAGTDKIEGGAFSGVGWQLVINRI
jgi:EH domain-containing protein 1